MNLVGMVAMAILFFYISPAMAGTENYAALGFGRSFIQVGGMMNVVQFESAGKSADNDTSVAPNVFAHWKMKNKPVSFFLGYSQQEEIQNFPNGNSVTQGVVDDLPAFGWTQSFKNSAKYRRAEGGVVIRKGNKLSISGGIFHVSAEQGTRFSMVDTLGLLPLDLDSSSSANGIGFSFGVEVRPTEKTKLALIFRSGAELSFDQNVKTNTMGGIFPDLNTTGFRDDVPAMLAVEASRTFPTTKGTFEIQAGYVREIGGSSEDVFGAKINRDANKFSVGGSWAPNQKVRFRLGFGITDAGNSLSEIYPNLSSKTVLAGLDFGLTKNFTASIDVAKIFYDPEDDADQSGWTASTGMKLSF